MFLQVPVCLLCKRRPNLLAERQKLAKIDAVRRVFRRLVMLGPGLVIQVEEESYLVRTSSGSLLTMGPCFNSIIFLWVKDIVRHYANLTIWSEYRVIIFTKILPVIGTMLRPWMVSIEAMLNAIQRVSFNLFDLFLLPFCILCYQRSLKLVIS